LEEDATGVCTISKLFLHNLTKSLRKEYDHPEFRLLPREGVFAQVVHGGMVKPGDNLRVE